MSHFTTIKTKITELEILKKALKDLGYTFVEGKVKIKGFSGMETVDLAVKTSGYEIGFKKSGTSFEVVADWWGIPVDKEKFIASLTQRYAYHVIISEGEKQKFSVSEETQKDGSIKVLLRRWR